VRIILTGAVLCAFASTAFAAEHYVEVWNPPEARIGGTHAPLAGKKCRSKKSVKHHLASADHVAPRRIAEPALRASAPLAPLAPSAPATNRHPLIAPKISPDGHILQVSYRASARHAPAGIRFQ
jgi:hypothetical protein